MYVTRIDLMQALILKEQIKQRGFELRCRAAKKSKGTRDRKNWEISVTKRATKKSK